MFKIRLYYHHTFNIPCMLKPPHLTIFLLFLVPFPKCTNLYRPSDRLKPIHMHSGMSLHSFILLYIYVVGFHCIYFNTLIFLSHTIINHIIFCVRLCCEKMIQFCFGYVCSILFYFPLFVYYFPVYYIVLYHITCHILCCAMLSWFVLCPLCCCNVLLLSALFHTTS